MPFTLFFEGKAALTADSARLFGGVITLTSVFSAIPAVMRALPVFKDPRVREYVLKFVLVAVAALAPFCALVLFYFFCYIGVASDKEFAFWPLNGLYLLIALVAVFGFFACLLDINWTSPYRLYRDQLAKTFVSLHETQIPRYPRVFPARRYSAGRRIPVTRPPSPAPRKSGGAARRVPRARAPRLVHRPRRSSA
jgi:hypothetical protein